MESDNNLKAAIEACGIDKAEEIIAEMKAELKWDADVWFHGLIEGMELRTRPDRPGINIWDGLINGERVTLFEQDNNGTVWCRWKFVWRFLEEHHSTDYAENQAKMKLLLEEHLGWRVETTGIGHMPAVLRLEEHLGWRVETTYPPTPERFRVLEEHLGWR